MSWPWLLYSPPFEPHQDKYAKTWPLSEGLVKLHTACHIALTSHHFLQNKCTTFNYSTPVSTNLYTCSKKIWNVDRKILVKNQPKQLLRDSWWPEHPVCNWSILMLTSSAFKKKSHHPWCQVNIMTALTYTKVW